MLADRTAVLEQLGRNHTGGEDLKCRGDAIPCRRDIEVESNVDWLSVDHFQAAADDV
jgi:hypothetical protein